MSVLEIHDSLWWFKKKDFPDTQLNNGIDKIGTDTLYCSFFLSKKQNIPGRWQDIKLENTVEKHKKHTGFRYFKNQTLVSNIPVQKQVYYLYKK